MNIKQMLYTLFQRQNYWFKSKYQFVEFGSYSWMHCTRYGNYISFYGAVASRDTGAMDSWQEKLFTNAIPNGFRPHDLSMAVMPDRSENVGVQVRLYENGNIGLQTRFARVNGADSGVNFVFSGIAVL